MTNPGRHIGVLLACCLVLVSLASAGCQGNGDSQIEQYADSDGTVNGALAAIEVMKKMPTGAVLFDYIDVEAMRDDGDLDSLYDRYESRNSPHLFHDYGIVFDTVDLLARGGPQLIGGRLDFDALRDALSDVGFERNDNEGVETWTSAQRGAVAVMNDYFMESNETIIRNCVGVVESGDASMYDNSDFREVIDRLPDGLVVSCVKGAWEEDEYCDGLESSGFSLAKKDSDTLAVTVVFRFDSSASASDAVAEIRQQLESDEDSDLSNIQVTSNGKFVSAVAEGPTIYGLSI